MTDVADIAWEIQHHEQIIAAKQQRIVELKAELAEAFRNEGRVDNDD